MSFNQFFREVDTYSTCVDVLEVRYAVQPLSLNCIHIGNATLYSSHRESRNPCKSTPDTTSSPAFSPESRSVLYCISSPTLQGSRTNDTCFEEFRSLHSHSYFVSRPPPSPPSSWRAVAILARSLSSLGTLESAIHKLAPTNFAYASVEKDLGRSIGMPTARSIINCGSTPIARLTPNSTV